VGRGCTQPGFRELDVEPLGPGELHARPGRREGPEPALGEPGVEDLGAKLLAHETGQGSAVTQLLDHDPTPSQARRPITS